VKAMLRCWPEGCQCPHKNAIARI